jgi:hypothetical protein
MWIQQFLAGTSQSPTAASRAAQVILRRPGRRTCGREAEVNGSRTHQQHPLGCFQPDSGCPKSHVGFSHTTLLSVSESRACTRDRQSYLHACSLRTSEPMHASEQIRHLTSADQQACYCRHTHDTTAGVTAMSQLEERLTVLRKVTTSM